MPHLTNEELLTAWRALFGYKPLFEDFQMLTTALGRYHTNMALSDPALSEIKEVIEDIQFSGNFLVEDKFSFFPEFYCGTYVNQVTLTPDGYILGCGCDVSDPDYWTDKYAGNVCYKPLKELIEIGRKGRMVYCNKTLQDRGSIECSHECGI